MKIETYLPRWTKSQKIEDSGRDPLGLARVHERLTDWLVPGITTQTDRARYYSFYLWSIYDTNRTDMPSNRRQFIEGMRRREAVFVLSCLAHHDGVGPVDLVGVEKGSKIWKRDPKPRWFSTDFQPLPSNPLGGYSQYYGGSLYRLGLTHTPENANGVDQLTPGGRKVAEAFESSISRTQFLRGKHQVDDELSFTVLRDLGNKACLCELPGTNGAERELLTNLFFGLDEFENDDALLRRQTLLLCLDVIDFANRSRMPIHEKDFDHSVLREAAYFRQIGSDKKTIDYAPGGSLGICSERWRLVELHRYYAYVLETLFATILSELEKARAGLSLDEFVSQLDWADMSAILKKWGRIPERNRLADWLASIAGDREQIDKTMSRSFDRRVGLGARLNEIDICDETDETESPSKRIVLSLALLFTLYCRFYNSRATDLWGSVSGLARDDLWFDVTARRIDNHLARGSTVKEFLCDLIQKEVVDQHKLITVVEKGHIENSWLQLIDGKLLWRRTYAPVWRSAKLENCRKIICDLSLAKVNPKGTLSLTSRGRALQSQLL